MTSADGARRTGCEAVLDQMEAILERQGVQRFGAAGEGFDPERHEAVAVRESDDGPRPHRSSTSSGRATRSATACCARRR